jgi:hypothetical protein
LKGREEEMEVRVLQVVGYLRYLADIQSCRNGRYLVVLRRSVHVDRLNSVNKSSTSSEPPSPSAFWLPKVSDGFTEHKVRYGLRD